MRPIVIFCALALLVAVAAAVVLLSEDLGLGSSGRSGTHDVLGSETSSGDAKARGDAGGTGPAASASEAAAREKELRDAEAAAAAEDLPTVLLLTGRVTTRKAPPPEKAQVAATAATGRLVSTETQGGLFRIEGPPGDVSRLVVTAAGFAAAILEDIPQGTELTVVLEPGVAFKGHVASLAAQPMEGVDVTILRKGHRDARPLQARTDAEGAFLIESVPAGRYDVSLIKDGVAPLFDNDLVIPPEGLKKRYVMYPGFSLFGEVMSVDRKYSIQGAQIEVVDRILRGQSVPHQSRTMGPFVTDAEGRFEIPALGPGEIRLLVKAQGFAAHIQSFKIQRAEEDKNRVEIRLKEGGSVTGTVLDPDGKPVGWARVMVEPRKAIKNGRDYMDVMGFLFGTAEFEDDVGMLPPAVTADAQGRFVLAGTPPGKGFLQAFDAKKRFAPSERVPVTIGAQQTPMEVELRLRPALRVAGVVQDGDGKPVAEATVKVNRIRALSEADGTFILESVPEGEHLCRVSHAHYDKYTEKVQVGSGGLEGLVIRLEAGQVLTGTVLDRRRNPVVGARVLVMDRKRRKRIATGVTGYDGSFYLGGLKRDVVFMRVHAEGFFSEIFEDLQTSPKAMDIKLTQRPWEQSADILGTVVQASNGRPVYNFVLEGFPPSHVQIFEGTFYIQNLSPGSRSFWVRAPGYQRHRVKSVDIQPGREIRLDPVRLHRAVRLLVDVRDHRGRPLKDGKVQVRARMKGKDENPGWARRPKPPGRKSRYYEFAELRVGSYTVTVRHPGHRASSRTLTLRRNHTHRIRLRRK